MSQSADAQVSPRAIPAFGATYIDRRTGVQLVAAHPILHPREWAAYLVGMETAYRERGLDPHIEALKDGAGVALFFLAYGPDGRPIGGIRYNGPYDRLDQVAAVYEMAGSPQHDEYSAALSAAIPEGLIEMKGMWSLASRTEAPALAGTLIRAASTACRWLGVTHCAATAADRIIPIATYCGVLRVWDSPVPWPDERYATVGMLFGVESLAAADPESREAHESDYAQLLAARPSPSDDAACALVLDPATRYGRVVRAALEPHARLVDTYNEQLVELAESDPGLLPDERWVYYPWHGTLVHTLGPASFARLRLSRNRNKVTLSEQYQLRAHRVGVVGSSAGHAIAVAIAQEGVAGSLRLADFDDLSLSNLNRIPARLVDIGLNKCVVAARRIADLDPYAIVDLYPSGITSSNVDGFLEGLDAVVEECDSLDVKVLIRERARARRLPVIMETSDRGVLDVERFDLEPFRPLFHGRLGDVASSDLEGLSLADRGPYVFRILGIRDISARAAASLLEIDSTLSAWPQLASEISLGAAVTTTALRQMFLHPDQVSSGRVRIDMDHVVTHLDPLPHRTDVLALDSPPPTDPPCEDPNPMVQVADAARRAPSGGNVQPWRLESEDAVLRIYSDLARSSSAMDIQSRGSYVALGAALLNARVRASALNRLGPVRLLPEGTSSTLVAEIELGSASDSSLSVLDGAIVGRAANRRRPAPATWDHAWAAPLDAAVRAEGARLNLITDPANLLEVATMLGETDRRRFLLGHVHREMIAELRWPGRDDLASGLDVRTLEMDSSTLSLLSLLSRSDVMAELAAWRAGQQLTKSTREAVSEGLAAAIITVPRAGVAGYLRGGQALERFWLTAHTLELAVQPTAPVFLYADGDDDLLNLGGERNVDALHDLFEQFTTATGVAPDESLVMVMRVFRAPPPTVHSIRRPLDEVYIRA